MIKSSALLIRKELYYAHKRKLFTLFCPAYARLLPHAFTAYARSL